VNGQVFMLKNKDAKNHGDDDKLRPLTKNEALARFQKFRKDLGLQDVHTSKERIKTILEKSGLLSEEVTKIRLEET